MELEQLAQLKELGIAVVAVIVIGYITKYIVDKNFSVFQEMIRQLDDVQVNYTRFVTENNHQKTDMVKEHTEVLVQVRQSIEANTKSTEQYNRTLEKLIDSLG